MSAPVVWAVLLAGITAALAVPSPARMPGQVRARRGLPPSAMAAVLVVGVLGVALVLTGLRGLLWAVLGCAVAFTGGHLTSRARAERRRRRAGAEVAHACQVVAGQLRLGAVPSRALLQAAADSDCMERAAATQLIGGDVGRALREAGAGPGREGLVSLARAWELGERTGAPIAALTLQVSDQVRGERAARQLVDAELSGPRSTARLLAFLPLVGIVMGRASGGDPVGFLLHTVPGLVCLVCGVLLACAGVLWTEQMARAARRP